VKEISREEWDQKFPGREPITVPPHEDNEVFSANITHNLNKMADAAGLYRPLWRPEEMGFTKAGELILWLETGLLGLKASPDRYKAMNPANGWGTYEGLVEFTEKYLNACRKYPEATISVGR
jgi:hypothetical protein